MQPLNSSVLAVVAIFEVVYAAQPSCSKSSISSCSKAIETAKTKTAALTSFCSSVLGCTKTTTTITGEPVTVTITTTTWQTFTETLIGTETTSTSTYSFTETENDASATVTVYPTWTVEKFVITTKNPKPRALGSRDNAHPRDFINERAPSSICPPADETKACSCLIGGCDPPITKDARKTKKTTETAYSEVVSSVYVTYTDIEYSGIFFTETSYYLATETSGIIVTDTKTIKCTPSATSSTSFFYLQATNAPDINGKYLWAAPLNPRLQPDAINGQFTDSIDDATAFSLEPDGRLVTKHKNGTQFANIDYFGPFELFQLMTRKDVRVHGYNYLRCSLQAPSGNFPGGFKELYCLADGSFHRDVWNYCPIYKEWYNTGLVLGEFWSESDPDCYKVTFLVKPICGWS